MSEATLKLQQYVNEHPDYPIIINANADDVWTPDDHAATLLTACWVKYDKCTLYNEYVYWDDDDLEEAIDNNLCEWCEHEPGTNEYEEELQRIKREQPWIDCIHVSTSPYIPELEAIGDAE